MDLLLDTHSLIWFLNGDEKLHHIKSITEVVTVPKTFFLLDVCIG